MSQADAPWMRRRLSSALVAFVGVPLALVVASPPACVETCDCAGPLPFLTVRVVDGVDAGPIGTARVNDVPRGFEGVCAFRSKPDGGPASAGPVSLTVAAQGYETRSLTVDVPATQPADDGCCGVGPPYIPQITTVALQPL